MKTFTLKTTSLAGKYKEAPVTSCCVGCAFQRNPAACTDADDSCLSEPIIWVPVNQPTESQA